MIKVIVTFPPGGSADIVMRALEPVVAAELKQGFVIENRAGAGGNIGMAAVAQARPDGYTLGVAPAGALTVTPHFNQTMPFDPKDLAPITLLAEIPFVLVASGNVPAHSVAETIALARAKPGALSIGHGGNSTAMHLTAALFTQKAGVAMELVPYRGTAPAAVDVLAGHVPFAVLDIPASKQLILEGKLNAIGVSSARRLPTLPDVPTLAESGIGGFESVGWFGLVAPAGTPGEIVARLNAAFVKALGDPSVIEKIRTLGAEPAPTSPEQFARFIQSESAKWGKLVSEAGIKPN
ncbi:tripartite tricarboxylate transporter substrate binding protein [Bradyrhizobium liaoningense]|uniref:Bug family tripartite tricarboxylate transporter substrate binding protein n=1 Tax=Bradyrhizobium liaoningense TaxID=43992 RepID=UPI0020133919|nr:tripartite tricarboxylate transporter substrate binding protein [Bradyrhizobium liaoningense]